jgi:hypothetical protein
VLHRNGRYLLLESWLLGLSRALSKEKQRKKAKGRDHEQRRGMKEEKKLLLRAGFYA